MTVFNVDDRVQKKKGYRYPGLVLCKFLTLEREVRYVVEALHPDYRGMLHIFNGDQLELIPDMPNKRNTEEDHG